MRIGFLALGLALCVATTAVAYPKAKKKDKDDEPKTKVVRRAPAQKRPQQPSTTEPPVQRQPTQPNIYYRPSSNTSETSTRKSRTESNRTNFKTQTEEYLNTHQPGRIYDLGNGEYKSGQENKVYVDGHTRSDGTEVHGHKRSYPGGKRKSSKNRNNSTLDFNRHTRGKVVNP